MDTLLLIIAAIILIETSVLLVRRPGNRSVLRASDRAILIDTSVLIDGRILDIAGAGFAPGRLVIPRSVLGELQLLADGSDHEKRARARNGLEVVTELQSMSRVSMEIYGDESEAREGVDNRLLALARRLGYELCTVDYNLQKVAEAEGITILSINDLAQKLRALYLPGEKLELLLKQKGQEKGQAVGYASDGTMVVVDNADKLLESTVSVEVIRSLQTSSGKMMFAKLVNKSESEKNHNNGKANGNGGGTGASRLFSRNKNKKRPDSRSQKQSQTHTQSESRQPQSPEDELLDLVNKQ